MAVQNAGNIVKIKKRDDFRGKYPTHLNEDVAYHLGWALMETVFSQPGRKGGAKVDVAVGWDARLSSPALAEALIHGLDAHGATVHALGMCSSEMLYFAVGSHPQMAGGVMVTASHNPKDENGFKIVKQAAESISGRELDAIARKTEELLASGLLASSHSRPMAIGEAYADRVIRESRIRPAWSGGRLRIVVEAGNGVGALAFREVARKLPYLDVIYSDARPNGEFPVCLPNPVKPEYMALVREKVLDNAADLGLAFDGDGDRVAAVDRHGEVITPSEVMAIIVDCLLPDQGPDGKPLDHSGVEVMYNLTCSRLVRDLIESKGARPLLTPVGHGQIKPVLRDHFAEEYFQQHGRRCVFAGEHSGHYFFPTFYYADSGTTAGLMIVERLLSLREQGRDLAECLGQWRQQYFAIPETNFDMRLPNPNISEAEQQSLLEQSVQRVREFGAKNQGQPLAEYDVAPDPPGVKIQWPTLKLEFFQEEYDWWLCVRPSGNEPLLRLNLEVILSEKGRKAGVSGAAVLAEKSAALVQVIGPQFLEKK